VEIEQVLKDTYNFYKNSPKRRGQLTKTVTREDQLFNALLEAMESEVDEGERDLEKIPTLRLQKWNATRWLGRARCLTTLCNAYEYVLEHLHKFSQTRKETKQNKDFAANLYQRLTAYNTFLFIFLYRDLTDQLAITSKWLQERAITIRDIGRRILNLNERLIGSYPEDSLVPVPVIDIGKAHKVLKELFGEDLNSISKSNKNLLISQISSYLKRSYFL